MVRNLLEALRVRLEARAEMRRTHCCWCLHDLEPLDALTTAQRRRLVHPGCKPLADAADDDWVRRTDFED